MTDAVVARRWPSLPQAAAAVGLQVRFVPADDESVDDAIELSRIGAGSDEDLGDVQICEDGAFCGNSWTSVACEARRQGPPRTTAEAALADLIGYLRTDGML